MANQINLVGRLTKDCELSYLPGAGIPKITFVLAVSRNYQKDKNNKVVDFIPCEMIGRHTEKLASYLTKGKQIYCLGELNIDVYEKDGQKKSFTKVKVDRVEFVGGGHQENTMPKNEFEAIDDNSLPF
ncbi:MAG: single-stranded DNA-binding protein [Romboutsia timonensis]